jgi:hypothetical protein
MAAPARSAARHRRPWHTLVHEKLNYRRPYGVQGGDWGAVVSSWAAFDHPLKDEKDDGSRA